MRLVHCCICITGMAHYLCFKPGPKVANLVTDQAHVFTNNKYGEKWNSV